LIIAALVGQVVVMLGVSLRKTGVFGAATLRVQPGSVAGVLNIGRKDIHGLGGKMGCSVNFRLCVHFRRDGE
jgi:hypothetical protein